MIDFDSIQQISDTTWLFSWSGAGPWNIYLEGVLLKGNTTATTHELTGGSIDAPSLEVVLTTDEAQNVTYAPRIVLQWEKSSDSAAYRIYSYISSTWKQVGRITESGNQRYYRYTTPSIADGTTYNYRVVPVNKYETEGTPLSFEVFHVRNPRTPAVDVTYSKPNVVVSERA